MSSLCRRNAVDRMSPVHRAILQPISAVMFSAEGPQAPSVSMAIGAKEKSPDLESSMYLACFLLSAAPAADPAAVEER